MNTKTLPHPAWAKASTIASVGAILTGLSGVLIQGAHLLPPGNHWGQVLLGIGVSLGGANTLCNQISQALGTQVPAETPNPGGQI